jgi:nucleoside-diphosphate-sugar epimerase
MNILLCGASGFIGRHIASALQAAGHHVQMPRTDFSQDTLVDAWLSRLADIDAVVNAVGVLRDSRQRPMQAVHHLSPAALFDACAAAGVKRVIHVSALGVDGNPTNYARTKRLADEHLLTIHRSGRLQALVLRPSIVFGKGGSSSALFMRLARMPWLCLPRPVIEAKVQPVSVLDLADAVAHAIEGSPFDEQASGLLHVVGSESLTLADFIGRLRLQLGHAPSRVHALPERLTNWSARLGDAVPWAPWCTETLALLAQDNVADGNAFAQLLGRPPVAIQSMVRQAWS